MAKTHTSTLKAIPQDSAIFYAHDGGVDYLLMFSGLRGGRYMMFTEDKTLFDTAMQNRKGLKASFSVGAYDRELGAYKIKNLVLK